MINKQRSKGRFIHQKNKKQIDNKNGEITSNRLSIKSPHQNKINHPIDWSLKWLKAF